MLIIFSIFNIPLVYSEVNFILSSRDFSVCLSMKCRFLGEMFLVFYIFYLACVSHLAFSIVHDGKPQRKVSS